MDNPAFLPVPNADYLRLDLLEHVPDNMALAVFHQRFAVAFGTHCSEQYTTIEEAEQAGLEFFLNRFGTANLPSILIMTSHEVAVWFVRIGVHMMTVAGYFKVVRPQPRLQESAPPSIKQEATTECQQSQESIEEDVHNDAVVENDQHQESIEEYIKDEVTAEQGESQESAKQGQEYIDLTLSDDETAPERRSEPDETSDNGDGDLFPDRMTPTKAFADARKLKYKPLLHVPTIVASKNNDTRWIQYYYDPALTASDPGYYTSTAWRMSKRHIAYCADEDAFYAEDLLGYVKASGLASNRAITSLRGWLVARQQEDHVPSTSRYVLVDRVTGEDFANRCGFFGACKTMFELCRGDEFTIRYQCLRCPANEGLEPDPNNNHRRHFGTHDYSPQHHSIARCPNPGCNVVYSTDWEYEIARHLTRCKYAGLLQ